MPTMFLYAVAVLGAVLAIALVMCLKDDRREQAAAPARRPEPQPARLASAPAPIPAPRSVEGPWRDAADATPTADDRDDLRREVQTLKLALAETNAALRDLQASLAPSRPGEPKMPNVAVFDLGRKRTG